MLAWPWGGEAISVDGLGKLHHVTLVTRDARRSLAFYSGVLGLRLVKRTVDCDDPTASHLYLGDATGRPGTLLTLIQWSGLPSGRAGIGTVHHIALSLSPASRLEAWRSRLEAAGVAIEAAIGGSLEAIDPDGCRVELLVNDAGARATAPDGAIAGLDHVLLCARDIQRTAAWCERALGLGVSGRSFLRGDDNAPLWCFGPGRTLRYFAIRLGGKPVGHVGPGLAHHIAFRVPDEAALHDWVDRLRGAGVPTTAILDRFYHRCVDFRDPDGNLFELATDGPGLAVDERPGDLGGALRLPPWLEPRRDELSGRLGAL